jgi:glycine/D-amino acid oxidase-like deaminating enzyme
VREPPVPDRRYRDLSLWHDTFPGSLEPRPRLPGDRHVDVAIVGAGYTGLWTAYYLKRLDPGLRIEIVEREIAGYGASGRNGGWCVAMFPASFRRLGRDADPGRVLALQAALDGSVDEVGRIAADEGIECGFRKGGAVSVARSRAQLARARSDVASVRAWGLGDDHLRLLDATEARRHLNGSRVLGGTFVPHCAALDPLRLVRGLADAVERLGVPIHEQTPATSIGPGRVETTHGTIRAEVVLPALEGYAPGIPGLRRSILPMYSLMVATEPLPAEVLSRIGLEGRETFTDKRHLKIYGQRTADGRIAFGGRGAPYHLGSTIRPAFDRDARVHRMLRNVLRDLLPALADVRFTHAWGGNLGIPRDWYPSVGFDRSNGLAWAGGYVGDGVATSNLAARTVADLVLGRHGELTELPWVGHRSPRWEPEPFRWVGVNAVTALMWAGDRLEAVTGRPAAPVRWFWRSLGH